MKWSVVYERAIQRDGSLYFPERLTEEFLENAKRVMGSYMFSNQYLNEVIPEEDQVFKQAWVRYYKQLPELKNTFAFIDPAISQENSADYTALVIVDVDADDQWYVRLAKRFRINPTEIVSTIFKVAEKFKPNVIGVEDVAYQKALLYMIQEEMKRRKVVIPVKGIRPDSNTSKNTRIGGLVPRFEWGRLFLAQGLEDLEMELFNFPRGAHDDLIDSLSYIERIAYTPIPERKKNEAPPPNHPDYEKWYINRLQKAAARGAGGGS